jgi:hypothetical protein
MQVLDLVRQFFGLQSGQSGIRIEEDCGGRFRSCWIRPTLYARTGEPCLDEILFSFDGLVPQNIPQTKVRWIELLAVVCQRLVTADGGKDKPS